MAKHLGRQIWSKVKVFMRTTETKAEQNNERVNNISFWSTVLIKEIRREGI